MFRNVSRQDGRKSQRPLFECQVAPVMLAVLTTCPILPSVHSIQPSAGKIESILARANHQELLDHLDVPYFQNTRGKTAVCHVWSATGDWSAANASNSIMHAPLSQTVQVTLPSDCGESCASLPQMHTCSRLVDQAPHFREQVPMTLYPQQGAW
jgi:hypothetical protein